MIVASLNVRYRDTAHLVEVAMIAWFWLESGGVRAGLIRDRVHEWFWVYMINPMAPIIGASQRAIYGKAYYTTATGTRSCCSRDPGIVFYLKWLAVALAVSLVLLVIGRRLFARLSGDFAEEL